MKKSNEHNEFLKGKSKGMSFTQHHQDELGMDVPKDFFASSKQNILDLVKEEVSQDNAPNKVTKVFYLRRSFQIAASIAALVVLTVWFQVSNSDSEIYVASDDTLIESLFVTDDSMNDFVDGLLVSEVVEGAEKSEQELENIFINSLFVEDTLLESYTNKSLVDHIIL